MSLPDLDGLELQKRVASDRVDMPVIFISGVGDVPKTVRAMKAGALEFLTKPLASDVFVVAIEQAIQRSRTTLDRQEAVRASSLSCLQSARTAGHDARRVWPAE